MQLSSDADVGQKGGCFVRACLQGFVLSIGSLPKKRGRRARRKTTRLFCTRAVLQPTCVADFSRTQTTTFTFLNVRRRPVQQSPPHSIKRSGQAFSCAQPFFGVLRVCVCVPWKVYFKDGRMEPCLASVSFCQCAAGESRSAVPGWSLLQD